MKKNKLNGRGQTTLFRIISDSNKNIKKEHFYRFMFLVSLQYLNEKEEFLSEVFIKGNKMFNINLDSLTIKSGKGKEASADDIEQAYCIAKERIFSNIKKKREYKNAINSLNKRLGREVERLYKHYIDQSTEKDFELENAKKRLRQLKSKLNHSRERKEILNLRKNIKFKEEQIKILKEKEYQIRMKAEREFFINDEKNKYALNVKINLFNVSVFYYK